MPQQTQEEDGEMEETGQSVTAQEPAVILEAEDLSAMLMALKCSKDSALWQNESDADFPQKFKTADNMKKSFSKRQVHTCLRTVAPKLKERHVRYGLS